MRLTLICIFVSAKNGWLNWLTDCHVQMEVTICFPSVLTFRHWSYWLWMWLNKKKMILLCRCSIGGESIALSLDSKSLHDIILVMIAISPWSVNEYQQLMRNKLVLFFVDECMHMHVEWWCNGLGVGLTIKRSQVRLTATCCHVTPHSHVHVPLTSNSIIWYRPEGDGALKLGR